METNDKVKYVLVVLAFAAWGALVVIGKADPGRYVDALALSIAGLGVHGATQRRSKSEASAPDVSAAPVARTQGAEAWCPTTLPLPSQSPQQAAAPATVQ